MTKTLSYSGFVVAILLVILVFVTAKTFSQLALATILYPVLVFAAFMIFPRNARGPSKIVVESRPKVSHERVETINQARETAYIADIDKRIFIKLIGTTGIAFFLFSILGRWAETFFINRTAQPGINPIGSNDQSGLAGSSPTDGYKISEIAEGAVSYYGFTNKDKNWLIMKEDSNESNFRYAKGGSDFPTNWGNRENLRYDYFYDLF